MIGKHRPSEIAELVAIMTEHSIFHTDEVTDTFRRVSTGELAMPETLDPDEKACVQEIFGRIADVGPGRALAQIGPLLTTGCLPLPAREAPVPPRPGAFAAIARLVPEGLFTSEPGAPVLKDLNEDHLVDFAIMLFAHIMYDDFHYPQPEHGMYDVATDAIEQVKWLYHYRFNQLEIAQPGSGLEELFAGQDLAFPEGDGTAKRRVSLTCGGDLLAVDVLVPANTEHLFDGIADFYCTADIVSANLESTIASNKPTGRTQPAGSLARMNTSSEMFQRFRDQGKINFISTATNHALDWDVDGVEATLDVLRSSGARFAGTASSAAEQDDVIVVEHNGIKVALLTFTMDLNGHQPPADQPWLVNEVRFNDAVPAPDYTLVQHHIAAAKAKGADYIIAYCHWGWELQMYPHPNVVRAAHTLIDLGIDTILGNHPYVAQPMQRVTRPGRPDGLIVYAFGDFVCYHPGSRNSKLAYTTRFDIVQEDTSDGKRTYLANLQMLPVYILNADNGDGTHDCRILKFADVYANPDAYPLTDRERSELDHLHNRVLHQILIPEGGDSILAD